VKEFPKNAKMGPFLVRHLEIEKDKHKIEGGQAERFSVPMYTRGRAKHFFLCLGTYLDRCVLIYDATKIRRPEYLST
jgi:hypothetical protein